MCQVKVSFRRAAYVPLALLHLAVLLRLSAYMIGAVQLRMISLRSRSLRPEGSQTGRRARRVDGVQLRVGFG